LEEAAACSIGLQALRASNTDMQTTEVRWGKRPPVEVVLVVALLALKLSLLIVHLLQRQFHLLLLGLPFGRGSPCPFEILLLPLQRLDLLRATGQLLLDLSMLSL
jgi:hypothetical protein